MTEQEREKIKAGTDLTELARRFTVLGRSLSGPCPKCGGHDRFFIHTGGDHWGCRKCPVTSGDCFDLVMAATGKSFLEASEYLGAKTWERTAPKIGSVRKEKEPRHTWREDIWQLKAREALSRHQEDWNRIEAGMVWMRAHRGITESTCKSFGIGLDDMRGSVSVPYRLPDGRLTGVKYRRMIEPNPRKRFYMMTGSEPVVFGAQLLKGGDRPILMVEGEMNAMACWQAAGEWLDVVSVGTEARAGALWSLASVYGRRFAWVDREEVAAMIFNAPGQDVLRLVSPDGMDANDLLLKGLLADVLNLAVNP